MVTTVLFGLLYPLVVTASRKLFFPEQANGRTDRATTEKWSAHASSASRSPALDISIRGLPAARNGYDP